MEDTIRYLIELRKRLLRCAVVIGIIFIVLAIYANHVYHLFALPLLSHLGKGDGIIATSVTAPFIIPYKAAFVLSIYLTAPYWLYEIWVFIMPALYQRERRIIWLLLISSCALFYIGTLFAYFVVLPWMFRFFMHVAPVGVEVKPDITNYLEFVLQLLLAFGLAFELPIAMLVLVWTGIVSVAQLSRKRPYVIVGAFIVGMLLTPPDVVSQTLLAIPLWLLYELGLWMAKALTNALIIAD